MCEFCVTCSILEIYNEKLIDLLQANRMYDRNLKIKERPYSGHIDGLSKHAVASVSHIMSLVEQAAANRAVNATSLNEHSSRSHVLMFFNVDQKLLDGTAKRARMLFVDLAGSERVRESKSEGLVLGEAININKSLVSRWFLPITTSHLCKCFATINNCVYPDGPEPVDQDPRP